MSFVSEEDARSAGEPHADGLHETLLELVRLLARSMAQRLKRTANVTNSGEHEQPSENQQVLND